MSRAPQISVNKVKRFIIDSKGRRSRKSMWLSKTTVISKICWVFINIWNITKSEYNFHSGSTRWPSLECQMEKELELQVTIFTTPSTTTALLEEKVRSVGGKLHSYASSTSLSCSCFYTYFCCCATCSCTSSICSTCAVCICSTCSFPRYCTTSICVHSTTSDHSTSF